MNFEKLKLHLLGLSYRIMSWPRKYYHRHKALRNTNKKPTIICNNCTAGFLLHDLSLQFRTPTINLQFYSFEDFYHFVMNLNELQFSELQEVVSSYKYPVAELKLRSGNVIRIGFVHYHTFNEANEIWKKRFERVDFNNLYVLYEGHISKDDVVKFDEITYPKAILSDKDDDLEKKYSFYHGFDFYDTWYPGKVGDYKGYFSLKRYLDEFDYVSFLTNGEKS